MNDSLRFSSLVHRSILCLAAATPLIAAPAFAASTGSEPGSKAKSPGSETEKPKPKVQPPSSSNPATEKPKSKVEPPKEDRKIVAA